MIGTREVSRLTAAVFRLFVRLVATVVTAVAERVVWNTAIVAWTPPVSSLTRVLLTVLPYTVQTSVSRSQRHKQQRIT